MTEQDRDLFKRLFKLDPFHQDIPAELEEAYEELCEWCKKENTILTFKEKMIFAFLYRDKPVIDIVPGKALAEGSSVQVMGDSPYRAKVGKIVELAGLSEQGLARVKIKGDKAKYREIPMKQLRIVE